MRARAHRPARPAAAAESPADLHSMLWRGIDEIDDHAGQMHCAVNIVFHLASSLADARAILWQDDKTLPPRDEVAEKRRRDRAQAADRAALEQVADRARRIAADTA